MGAVPSNCAARVLPGPATGLTLFAQKRPQIAGVGHCSLRDLQSSTLPERAGAGGRGSQRVKDAGDGKDGRHYRLMKEIFKDIVGKMREFFWINSFIDCNKTIYGYPEEFPHFTNNGKPWMSNFLNHSKILLTQYWILWRRLLLSLNINALSLTLVASMDVYKIY